MKNLNDYHIRCMKCLNRCRCCISSYLPKASQPFSNTRYVIFFLLVLLHVVVISCFCYCRLNWHVFDTLNSTQNVQVLSHLPQNRFKIETQKSCMDINVKWLGEWIEKTKQTSMLCEFEVFFPLNIRMTCDIIKAIERLI